ncbi:restriction endonuclease subunit S [Pantoea agglomerans]|uniref:restriction endonuclease subunit S n=1 Tax=Enterobacter agglomerans TaxID=549 RepID=UPI0010C162BF|nr:restriction endonuclease subunit S [Pantoea agglomerans]MBD8158228.1 restriction endonuclease subunit S [Pantoea agglomerans]TKK37641.1 type I restriction endonuclease subunit S [Pantoea agglomerans]
MSEVKLPDGWIDTYIGEIAEIVAGGTPKSGVAENFVPAGTGIAWLTPADLSGYKDKTISYGARDLSEIGYKSSSAKLMPQGSLLFSSRAPIGYVVIAENNISTNQGFKNFLFTEHVISDYAYYYLRSIRHIAEGVGTGTTFKEISGYTAKSLPFRIAPLAEQKIIADKLDTLLAQVDSTKVRLEQIPQILKRFRQAVLDSAISGILTQEWRQKHTEIRVQSLDLINEYWESIYGENEKKRPIAKIKGSMYSNKLPKKWLNTRLGHVFDIFVGATPNRAKSEFWSGNIPWVSSSEVAFCKITKTKEAITELGLRNTSTSVHPKGTVMLAMIGQGKTRGQAAILEIEACHNQNTAALRVPEGFVLSEYLYYFLVQQYEETRRIGGGNNQQALNKSFVQSMGFPLPPIEEQTEIVRRVEQLFAYADTIEKQVQNALECVNNLTQSILSKAFRGELTAQWRVENPDLISGENSAQALLVQIQQQRSSIKTIKRGKGNS